MWFPKKVYRMKVSGPLAMFTRPDRKVERLSYPVITPSAAYGVIKAIFWNKRTQYRLRRIYVCKPIRWGDPQKHNECTQGINLNKAIQAMQGEQVILASDADSCMQRTSVPLCDVEYVLEFEMHPVDETVTSSEMARYDCELTRHIKAGCGRTPPCLGRSGYPAICGPCTETPPCPPELAGEHDLGLMFYGWRWSSWCADRDDKLVPQWYHARLFDGVIDVPDAESPVVLDDRLCCRQNGYYNYMLVKKTGVTENEALIRLSHKLREQGIIQSSAWCSAKVRAVIDIDPDKPSIIVGSAMLVGSESNGKKGKDHGRELDHQPARVNKSAIKANFITDTSGYEIGVDTSKDKEYVEKCFQASQELTPKVLSGAEGEPAKALLKFSQQWKPEAAATNSALKNISDVLNGNGNITIRYRGKYLFDDPEIRRKWEEYFAEERVRDADIGMCMITGKWGPLIRVWPKVSLPGSPPGGMPFFSCKHPSTWTMDKKYCENAPVSVDAAEDITAAMNYLLKSPAHHITVGNMTVLFWTETDDREKADAADELMRDAMAGENGADSSSPREKLDIVRTVLSGKRVDSSAESHLSADCRVYVLVVVANAGRVSQRVFLQNTLGVYLENINAHYERMRIGRINNGDDPYEGFYPYQVLKTVTGSMKVTNQRLAQAYLMAIINGEPYPDSLYHTVYEHICSSRYVTRIYAAVIRSVFLRQQQPDMPLEILTEYLNETSKYMPYVLGRLMAVAEDIQRQTNHSTETTIHDKSFLALMQQPVLALPVLMVQLAYFLDDLPERKKIFWSRQIGGLFELMPVGGDGTVNIPGSMTEVQQLAYALGYYQQRIRLHMKRNTADADGTQGAEAVSPVIEQTDALGAKTTKPPVKLALNTSDGCPGYILGCLLAQAEVLQNNDGYSTVEPLRSKYAQKLSTCPTVALPGLMEQVMLYLSRNDSSIEGRRISQIGTLLEHIQITPDGTLNLPDTFTHQQSCAFFAGYWHMTDWIYARQPKQKAMPVNEVTPLPSLCVETGSPAYQLGRLLAASARIQSATGRAVQKAVVDTFFRRLCTEPAKTAPVLLKTIEVHLGELKPKSKAAYWRNQLKALVGNITDQTTGRMLLPEHFSRRELCEFYVGYWHQIQQLVKPKANCNDRGSCSEELVDAAS